MENVPRELRVIISNETKIELEKIIIKNKIKLKIMKEQNVDKIGMKSTICLHKMDIYSHNGDFYNMYRQFKKFKKLSYFAIENYEERMKNHEDICVCDFEDKIFYTKENGYLQLCDNIKNKIDYYEDIVNEMYSLYKNNSYEDGVNETYLFYKNNS
mgnify:CR=1 FL=1